MGRRVGGYADITNTALLLKNVFGCDRNTSPVSSLCQGEAKSRAVDLPETDWPGGTRSAAEGHEHGGATGPTPVHGHWRHDGKHVTTPRARRRALLGTVTGAQVASRDPAASCGPPASIGRATLKRSRRRPKPPTLLRVGFTEPPQSPAALDGLLHHQRSCGRCHSPLERCLSASLLYVAQRPEWQVRFHPDAREEERKLPAREKLAMANAIDKLGALGPALPYPHSSDVRGADRLRELRPRAGRSR